MNNIVIIVLIIGMVFGLLFTLGCCKVAKRADEQMEEIYNKMKNGETDERNKNI